MTPKGTEILLIISPLGLSVSYKFLPIGSGSLTISSTDLAIPSILSLSSISLLSIAFGILFFFAKFKSSLFAVIILSFSFLIFSAIDNKRLSLALVERDFSSALALTLCWPTLVI